MNSNFAVAISDIILSCGTFFLGMSLSKRRNAKIWAVLFVILSFAAGLGAVYHGLDGFHTREFWVLVSTTTTASAFLFLSAVLTVYRPNNKFYRLIWPALGVAGLLAGGMLSPFPFWYISVVSAMCLIVSILLLTQSPLKVPRNWILTGIAITLLALVLQKVAGNAIFHYVQLLANLCFWLGAKKT